MVFCGEHMPTRGVPQGGVLSPFLWLLHVNRIIEETLCDLRKTIKMPPLSWDVIIQIFADGIFAAIGHDHRPAAIQLVHLLIAALGRQLDKTELNVSLPKCKNFLVEKKTRQRGSKPGRARRRYETEEKRGKKAENEARPRLPGSQDGNRQEKRRGAAIPVDLQL